MKSKKQINILMLGSLDGIKGGVANYIGSILKGKDSNDLNFYLGCIGGPHIEKNAKVITFDIRYNLYNVYLKIQQLKSIISEYNIDIIHAHTQRAGLLLALLGFKKFVYTPHGLRHLQIKGVKKIIHFILEKIILRQAYIVTALTKSELEEIHKVNPACPTIQINTRIDDHYHALRKNNIQTVIMVGSCDKNKNPKLFIEFAENLRELSIKFIWVGDGPLLEKCRDSCRAKNLKNISFIGQKSHVQSIKAIEKSHILLFTSKMESFPITIIEAMMCKTLVFSNNYKGIQNIIEHNKTGVIYDCKNIEAACEELKHLLFNEIKREVIINQARDSYLENYWSSKIIYKDYLLIYSKIQDG